MSDHNISFLFIEADPLFRLPLTGVIEQLGYGRVAAVSEMREALAVLASGAVDFVICDWSDVNNAGLGLLKLLKAQEVYKFIPFLMVAYPLQSSLHETDRQRRVLAARGDGYLAKPFDVDQLRVSVDQILSRYPSL